MRIHRIVLFLALQRATVNSQGRQPLVSNAPRKMKP
jgi:hypothetical protein